MGYQTIAEVLWLIFYYCLVSLETVHSPRLSEVIVSQEGSVLLLHLNSNHNRLEGVQLDHFVTSQS